MTKAAKHLSSRKWIYLAEEVKVRGFTSRLLLAATAAEAGLAAVFGEKVAVESLLPMLPAGVLVTKSVLSQNYAVWAQLRRGNHRYASLDEEGISPYLLPEHMCKLRCAGESLPFVWRVFTNNADEQERLTDGFPDFTDRFVLTGNPRMDIWGTDLCRIYDDQVKAIRARFGDYVLIPSNFSGSTIKITREERMKMFQLSGVAHEKELIDYYMAMNAHQEVASRGYQQMLFQLGEAFPEATFVFRPHPAEVIEIWRERLRDYRNIHVVCEGEITPWVLGAQCLIHHGCTSGVEAAFARRPAIIYMPNYDNKFDRGNRMSMDAQAFDEKGLHDQLSRVFSGNGVVPCEGREAARRAMLMPLDPGCSSRIAEILRESPCDAQAVDLTRLVRDIRRIQYPGFKRIIKDCGGDAVKSLLKRLKLYPQQKGWEHDKWPGSTLAEVEDMLGRFRQVTGKFGAVRAVELGVNIFLFHA